MSQFECKGLKCPQISEAHEEARSVRSRLCGQYALDTSLTEGMADCGLEVLWEDLEAYRQGVEETAKLAGVNIFHGLRPYNQQES